MKALANEILRRLSESKGGGTSSSIKQEEQEQTKAQQQQFSTQHLANSVSPLTYLPCCFANFGILSRQLAC